MSNLQITLAYLRGQLDLGGPKWELFRLCLKELKDCSGMFEGPSYAKLLGFKSTAMKTDSYYHAGQLMAMSIVHDGQTPCFLSENLIEALVQGPENVEVTVDDVPDIETQSMLKRMINLCFTNG
ncbi:hypothetical protein SKAU_G00150290 [Synaphobranchus kaupii]|uniref:Uncharacterized protein n=1 Tax=Synaphobranchus kaupii TaxID=118154 RepID=A0A9Q1J560_SYNKA|nr:hypothetical protein SKAU_G00150290 [Synaphobranchus kaupii]